MKILIKPENRYFLWFLLFYSLWGFYNLPNTAVPLDELTQRYIGIQNNRFISGAANFDVIEKEGPFGPIFESICYALEQVVYTQPMRTKLLIRHGFLFGLFLLAIWCFYKIGKRIFKTPKTAGIGAILLALYPPLFVHANINSKDTFFLILIVYCLYFLLRFFETKKLLFMLAMCMIAGMASTIRISGFIVFFIFITGIWFRKEIALKALLKFSLIGIFIFITSYYLFFPYLWLHPLDGIHNILAYTTNNPWPSKTLCAGILIQPGNAPWWYLLSWMGVTIPCLILALLITGTIQYFKNPKLRKSATIKVIFLMFFLPVSMVILIRPTLYDGWRHFQFLIVPITLIAGLGMEPLFIGSKGKIWSLAIAGYTAITFFLWTPYGFVYMNEFYATACPPNSFTQDYWGLSAKPCLEWIAAHDSSQNIAVASFTESPELNALILPEEIRKRFHFVKNDSTAKYEIEIRRQKYFGNIKGKEVFSICPMKDTVARVLILR